MRQKFMNHKRTVRLTALFLLVVFLLPSVITAQDELEEEYLGSRLSVFHPMEHGLINFSVGLVSGVAWGYAAGLSNWNSNNDTDFENRAGIWAGVYGLAGGVGGLVVTFVEYNKKEQFTIGKRLWEYGWYGMIAGGLLGGTVGLVPYGINGDDNLDTVYHYAGWGIIIGVPLSIGMSYFISDDYLSPKAANREHGRIALGPVYQPEGGFGWQVGWQRNF